MILDFSSKPKKTMGVKLKDGRMLLVMAPKKWLFNRLVNIEQALTDTEGERKDEVYDTLLQLTADILSNNIKNTRITAKEADSMFDLGEIRCIIKEYSDFVSGVGKDPN